MARVVQVMPPGGVLARPNYYVFVDSTEDERIDFDPKRAIWKSKDVYPQYLFWESEKEIEVLVFAEGDLKQVFTRSIEGLSVTTRLLMSSDKEALCNSELLEVLPTERPLRGAP